MLQGETKAPEAVSERILTRMRILSDIQGYRGDVPGFLTGVLLMTHPRLHICLLPDMHRWTAQALLVSCRHDCKMILLTYLSH